MNHDKPRRTWDSYDGYLFDIDGTLVECADAVHYFAFTQALTFLAHRELTLDGVVAQGNTDVGILRDALRLAEIPEKAWRPRLAEARERMGSFVEAHRDELRPRVLPQVPEVLAHLTGQGAKLAVATGNLERIGTAKLEQAGLWQFFDFGGWSDAFETRADVFGDAIQVAQQRWGKDIELCVVGDTPADIAAAHHHRLPVIAVATGIFPYAQLNELEPEWCVSSLAGFEPFM